MGGNQEINFKDRREVFLAWDLESLSDILADKSE
jgi:hypothetical protein